MELLTILLLTLMFIVSLINIYANLNTKTFAKLKSFLHPKKTQPPPPTTVVAAAKLTVAPPQKDDRKKVFATFDKNGDGFITKQELKDSLKNIRITLSDNELEDLAARLDENGDGLIDFEEFCKLCESNCVDSLEKMKIDGDEDEDGDLKEAFDVFDKDKDGLISVEELGSVLCSMGLREGKKMEDCEEMIKKIDVDGDGMVSFYEFKLMMRSGGSLVSVF